MRKQIAQESIEPYVDGRVWMPGCLTWSNEPLVIMGYDPDSCHPIILGKATDLRREDEGKITAEISFRHEVDSDRSLAVEGKLIRYSSFVDDPWTMTIHEGKILGVFVTEMVPWSPRWDGELAWRELDRLKKQGK